VATATKALQEQLLTKDVPAAAAALGRRVRVAILKGRQNYLCRKSLQGVDQLGGLFRTAEDAADFERLRDWIETTETGDRAELDFEPEVELDAPVLPSADLLPPVPDVTALRAELEEALGVWEQALEAVLGA